MHTIIKTGDQHFIVAHTSRGACVFAVDRFSGQLLFHGCEGQDLFQTAEEAVAHVMATINGRVDFTRQVAAILGYTILGFEVLHPQILAHSMRVVARSPLICCAQPA